MATVVKSMGWVMIVDIIGGVIALVALNVINISINFEILSAVLLALAYLLSWSFITAAKKSSENTSSVSLFQ